MAERHAPYAPEYRRQMVELVRTSRTPGELAERAAKLEAERAEARQAYARESERVDQLRAELRRETG